MDASSNVCEGMAVFAADGAKLGRVVTVTADEGTFVIEKGLVFKKDYTARFEDIEDVRADGVHLRRARSEVEREPRGIPAPPPGPAVTGGAMGTGAGIPPPASGWTQK